MMFINTIDVQDHRYDNTLVATGIISILLAIVYFLSFQVFLLTNITLDQPHIYKYRNMLNLIKNPCLWPFSYSTYIRAKKFKRRNNEKYFIDHFIILFTKVS